MRWALVLILLGSNAAADPKSHYMIHCMGCHLQDGRGLPPDVPAFDNKLAVLAATPRGREYLVRVPGAAQAPIDDASLAGVLNWILQEYTSGSHHVPFKASEIAHYRTEPLAQPAQLRAELLGNPGDAPPR